MNCRAFLPALLFLFAAHIAGAQIPRTISYQGVLTDATGKPAPDGNYSLTFRLYDLPSGTAYVWEEGQSIAVIKGIFNVVLGTANPLGIPFDKPYWLGLRVAGGPELAPRTVLTSSAYSLNTLSIVDTAVTGRKIADGQVVRSLNKLKDHVTLAAGTNVSITQNGDTLRIGASGGGFGLPYAGSVASATSAFAVINTGSGDAVVGESASRYGVHGNSISGDGVYGWSSTGYGVRGASSLAGVYGESATGDAVLGESGSRYGVHGNSTSGDGVYGWSKNGRGVVGSSSGSIAVYAEGPFTATGTKSATVKLRDGTQIRLFTEEAAEVYFSDYGEARLTNGTAHIELDPTFLQTVTVDAQHLMKVFVQLEGDCRGVFVRNKTATGFDVVELQGGVSGAHFIYRVVCKRRYFEDERLAREAQDSQHNSRMMETVWPEVIAGQQANREQLNAGPQRMPERPVHR